MPSTSLSPHPTTRWEGLRMTIGMLYAVDFAETGPQMAPTRSRFKGTFIAAATEKLSLFLPSMPLTPAHSPIAAALAEATSWVAGLTPSDFLQLRRRCTSTIPTFPRTHYLQTIKISLT